jgi:two-component system, OmpR family, alkaline phosphatase synthesis response regulator PhoP
MIMNERKTILIIDDDPDFVRSIELLLTASGYRVLTASNGRRGFDLARQERPDLILLDVMMTERTEGFFTLERIKEDPILHETPVIVISSIYTEQPIFRVDPAAGWMPADAFLPKPVDPGRLLEEAARIMATPAAERRRLGSVAR